VKGRETARLAKLQEQQKELAEKIRQERAKLKDEEKKRDATRKTILGGLVLKYYEENAEVKAWVDALLDAKVRGNKNRALFGLAPAPEKSG